MNRQDLEWTEEDRAALGALREEANPVDGLEAKVLAALSARGLVGPARPARWRTWVLAAAAAAAVFGLGALTGARRAPGAAGSEAAVHGARYVLFLEGAQPATSAEESSRVEEYRSWARKEAAAGRLLAGEKLEAGVREAGAAGSEPPGSAAVRGYFVITAATDEEALATARRCPHASHGGRVVLRKIADLRTGRG